MARDKDPSGQIAMARRRVWSISKTARLVGCSQSAVNSTTTNWPLSKSLDLYPQSFLLYSTMSQPNVDLGCNTSQTLTCTILAIQSTSFSSHGVVTMFRLIGVYLHACISFLEGNIHIFVCLVAVSFVIIHYFVLNLKSRKTNKVF